MLFSISFYIYTIIILLLIFDMEEKIWYLVLWILFFIKEI